ncbi:MAG: SIS domain-containing protein [Deltaproteobacteria bacterium]|nr:SIS domain-containing protein [Deltaproteobacteria bacterium]
MNWNENVKELSSCLQSLSVKSRKGKEIEPVSAFGKWRSITTKISRNRKTIFLIGNGASASMASHIAADLAKNVHLHTEVFSDLSLITAIGNDLGYNEVFAEPIKRRMKRGDMLIAISSSGQSPNIIHAVEQASSMGGYIITLSAMNHENRLRSLGILNFYIPAQSYGLAETCHAAILHWWVDIMLESSQRPSPWKKWNHIRATAAPVQMDFHRINSTATTSEETVVES